MKIVLDRQHAATVLKAVSAFSGKTIEVWCYLLIRSAGGVTAVTAYGEHGQCTMKLDCTYCDEGQLLVRGDTLLGLIQRANAPQVTLTSGETSHTLSFGQNKYKIGALAFDAFPEPVTREEPQFTLEAADLVAGMKSVEHAAAFNDVRRELNGVHLEIVDGKATTVGTDGHRMAIRSWDVGEPEDYRATTIPSRALSKIIGLLPDDGEVGMTLHSGNNIIIQSPEFLFCGPQVDGRYPAYRTLIREDGSASVVNAQALKQALERVSVVLADTKQKWLMCQITKASLAISYESSTGSLFELIELDSNCASPITIKIDPRYLLDALDSMIAAGASEVTIHVLNTETSLRLTSAEHGLIAIIMPLRM